MAQKVKHNQISRKKIVLLTGLCFLVLCVIACLLWVRRSQTLKELIDEQLSQVGEWRVTHIEEMIINKPPQVVYIEESSVVKSFSKILENTSVRFLRSEEGTLMTSTLYTLTITGKNDAVTLTFDNLGQVHFNQTEKTYIILGDSTELYSFIQDQYRNAE